MRTALATLVIAASIFVAAPAGATNYAFHMQGRGWKGWDTMQTVSANIWTNMFFQYDGNSSITDVTTTNEINNALKTYCNTTANSCVILCYSAGCNRMQKAVSDLHAAGYALPSILWAEATGSAGGGTGLAELATQGGTKILAKLLGQQEKIDFALTPSAARASAQTDFGKMIYHLAGNQDICKGFWIFKLCGNSYVGYGKGDGVVPFHSAFGCSSAGAVSDCNCTKYTYHAWDNRVGGTSCTGEPFDHFGMPNSGCKVMKTYLDQVSTTAVAASWSDASSNSLCTTTNKSCDDQFNNTGENYSKKVDTNLTSVATSVATKASNTTLYTDSRYIGGPSTSYDDTASGAGWRWSCGGKCGSPNTIGGTTRCYCDAACTSYGDCCDDYSTSVCTGRGLSSTDCANNTARCDVVNAQ
ncbi:MAG: hypothetical protein JO257_14505 [Deltaproteobacteria bacterium]|nr:hypothetical protein [Deltaproteobacteria bacterium]